MKVGMTVVMKAVHWAALKAVRMAESSVETTVAQKAALKVVKMADR